MADAVTPHRALGEYLTSRQKFFLLNSLMLCMFISALDQSIVATATPHILADLGGFNLLSWVFTVYLLSSTVVVPIVGKLSDMFGRKPFILVGIAIFLIGSAGSGAATSMIFLIVARAVQGVGGGMLFACVFSTLGDLFTPIERAKYMGYFIGAFTLASLTGPTIGGFLTDGPGWRWCFYINLPIGALATFFIWINLPYSKLGGKLSRIDFFGAAYLSGATVSLLLALVWANQAFGWGAPETIGLFAAAAVLTTAFIFQESRHPQAIFPLHLFRNRVFVQANLLVAVQAAGLFGAITYLPTFIQTALGASATSSGLVSTPQSVGLFVTSVIGGQVVARTGRFKYQVVAGSILIAVSAFFLTTLDIGVPKWHIAMFMIISGLGSGLVGPTVSVITQSSVGQEHIGVATSGRQFFMQIGQVLGVAVLGLVFSTTYSSQFTHDVPANLQAQMSPAVIKDFKDPTLSLDPLRLAAAKSELQKLPDGQSVLDAALLAQKEAISTATQRIFIGAFLSALVVVLLALTLPEIPLRRTFGAAPSKTLEGEAGGVLVESPLIEIG
jgi:EmrB/QacA subfamily drug resistance transporter